MAKLCLTLLTLFLLVALALTAKKPPSFTYRAAAEICRPYQNACRASGGTEKAQVAQQCFNGFINGCFQPVRTILDSMKECVEAAGDDLDSVSKCLE